MYRVHSSSHRSKKDRLNFPLTLVSWQCLLTLCQQFWWEIKIIPRWPSEIWEPLYIIFGNPDKYIANLLNIWTLLSWFVSWSSFQGCHMVINPWNWLKCGNFTYCQFYGLMAIWHPWNNIRTQIHDEKVYVLCKFAICVLGFPKILCQGSHIS